MSEDKQERYEHNEPKEGQYYWQLQPSVGYKIYFQRDGKQYEIALMRWSDGLREDVTKAIKQDADWLCKGMNQVSPHALNSTEQSADSKADHSELVEAASKLFHAGRWRRTHDGEYYINESEEDAAMWRALEKALQNTSNSTTGSGNMGEEVARMVDTCDCLAAWLAQYKPMYCVAVQEIKNHIIKNTITNPSPAQSEQENEA